MKVKLILAMIVSMSAFYSKAQTLDNAPWCPSGATWIYNLLIPWEKSYQVVTFKKDTLIYNQAVKKLDRKKIIVYEPLAPTSTAPVYKVVTNLEPLFMFERNDSIFNLHGNVFKFVYKFNPSIGDTLLLTNVSNDVTQEMFDQCSDLYVTDTVVCNSTNNIIRNNKVFKRYYYSSDTMYTFQDGIVNGLINKIGGSGYLLPRPYFACNSGFLSTFGSSVLTRYYDDIRGVVDFYGMDQAINDTLPSFYSFILTTPELPFEENKLSVFPNPSNDYLMLSSIENIRQLDIISLDGKVCNSNIPVQEKITIQNLTNGIYYLKVYSNTSVQSLKFIKNE
jgi:hypothetical protein